MFVITTCHTVSDYLVLVVFSNHLLACLSDLESDIFSTLSIHVLVLTSRKAFLPPQQHCFISLKTMIFKCIYYTNWLLRCLSQALVISPLCRVTLMLSWKYFHQYFGFQNGFSCSQLDFLYSFLKINSQVIRVESTHATKVLHKLIFSLLFYLIDVCNVYFV